MPLIETRVDRDSEEFRENAAHNVALANDLRALSEKIAIFNY